MGGSDNGKKPLRPRQHNLPPVDSPVMARLITKLFKNAYMSSPIFRASYSGTAEDMAALALFKTIYHAPKPGEEQGYYTVILPPDFSHETLKRMRLNPRSVASLEKSELWKVSAIAMQAAVPGAQDMSDAELTEALRRRPGMEKVEVARANGGHYYNVDGVHYDTLHPVMVSKTLQLEPDQVAQYVRMRAHKTVTVPVEQMLELVVKPTLAASRDRGR